MKRTSLGFLLTLNAVLLGAIYLTAGPVPAADAQFARNGARYTMVASETDGPGDEATVFVIDLQSGAAVPVQYRDGRNRFEVSRGRSISSDVAALVGESRRR